jgi:hypothetical protein
LKPLILLLALLFSAPAFSCSCSMGEVSEKLEGSKSVFIGTVKEIKYLDSANAFGDQEIVVSFSVQNQWKGEKKESTLHTAYNSAGCFGYWFQESKEYLIYAFEDEGRLNTLWCGGVISKDESKESFEKEVISLNKLTD